MNTRLGPLAALLVSLFAACGGKIMQEEASPDVEAVDSGILVPPPRPPLVVDSGHVEPPDDGWGKVPDRSTTAVTTLDLGAVSSGAGVPFAIPANTLGFNVGIASASPSADLAVLDIKSPAGALVLTSSIVFNGDHDSTTTIFGDVASAGVPGSNHTDAMPTVKPGTWTVKFGGGSGTAKVHVQSTPDGAFHGGYVDMHVYLAKGLSVDGDVVDEKNLARISGARDRIDAFGKAIHALYGLDRGNVTFHLIAGKWTTVDDAELGDLFRETKVAGNGQALHIFMVESTASQDWWGISGGIPGFATIAGTSQSAIALALIDSADIEGTVLAHEMGHFFGLSHTTELEGIGYDALEDTPKCPGMTQAKAAGCPDVTNVMFAVGSPTGMDVTSALQRRIVQGSPIYRAFPTGAPPTGGLVKGGDPGKLFGHPGRPLTDPELVVLAGLCGHPGHASHAADLARRTSPADLVRVAEAPGVSPVVRNKARALAALGGRRL